MDTEVLSPSQSSPKWSSRNIQESLAQAEKLASKAKAAGTSPLPPPRQLLQYLVRMGSFTSVPAAREDSQDVDFEVSANDTRESLIQRCVTELPFNALPIRRQFVSLGATKLFDEGIDSKKFKQNDILGLKRFSLIPERVLKSNENDYDDAIVDWASDEFESDIIPNNTGNPSSFRILTWNILAQALAVEHDNFVGLPDGTLDWSTRRLHILHEILHYNPDVICLQEVDHYNFINSALTPLGYRGVFCSKPDSPCIYLANNNGPDGCALFFRRDKFDLISASSRIIEIWRIQSNQVCIFANLRLRETGQQICVATTHLKARQGELLTTMRNEQGKDVSNFLNSCGASNKPLILCGDFNAVPSEPVVSTIKNRLAVKSAYSDLYGGDEPPYTTWKVREDGEYCQTLDYIFYNKFCSVDRALILPTEEQVGPSRLPNLNYPSDHIAIACDISVKSSSEQTP